MRVIAGTARSLRLKTPEGMDTRPTTDRIKETLFNMLQPDLGGALFVDLFSGSGGIGIEALSRGAQHAYFVENDRKALACIMENLRFTRLADQATVLKTDVLSALYGIHEKEADIIFMDPPYDCGHEKRVFSVLKELPRPPCSQNYHGWRNWDFSLKKRSAIRRIGTFFVEKLDTSRFFSKNFKINKDISTKVF